MTPSESIEGLLTEVLERLEQGDQQALHDVCASHPEQADAIRSRFERLRRLDLLGGTEDVEPPKRLGGFRLLERIGGGGMGVVYRALEEELGREVALKVIRPDQLHSKAIRERFRRETEMAARMQHPGIVPVYAVGSEGGIPYFTMEFLRGASLEEVLTELSEERPERLQGSDLAKAVVRCSKTDASAATDPADDIYLFAGSWEETCIRIAHRIAEALAHAHERQIYHRDIKPSNVMITPDGRVVLVDFGLSRIEGSDRMTLTQAPVGSLMYMPPELIERKGPIDDVRGDTYSLGATLFELLALAPPFDAQHAPSLLLRIARGERRKLLDCNEGLSWEAETVCETAMEIDPDRRYRNALDLGRDLKNILEHRPIEARRAGTLLRLRRLVQRRPTASVAAVLGALLVIGGPLVYARQEREASKELTELNKELEEALSEADVERTKAEENFDTAFESVQIMLERVGRDDLRNVPLVQEVRAELLGLAQDFYGRLLERSPGDARIRRASANAGISRGRVLDLLGDRNGSITMLLENIPKLEALVDSAEHPDQVRIEVARALGSLGRGMHMVGKVQESRRTYDKMESLLISIENEGTESAREEARRIREILPTHTAMVELKEDDPEGALTTYAQGVEDARAWLAENPENSDAKTILADLLNGHGRLLYRRNQDLRLAEELIMEAQEIRAQLCVLRPDDQAQMIGFFNASLNLAAVQMDMNKKEDADLAMDVAFEVAAQLTERFPSVPEYRSALGDAHITHGALLGNKVDYAGALESQDKACAVFEGLTVEFPNEPEFFSSLGLANSNAGWLLSQLDRQEEAEARLRLSIAAHEKTNRMVPNHPEFRAYLAKSLHNLLFCHVSQGKHEELLDSAQLVAELQPEGAASFFDLACFLAEGSRFVEQDPSLAPGAARDRARAFVEAGSRYLTLALEIDPLMNARDLNDPRLELLEADVSE